MQRRGLDEGSCSGVIGIMQCRGLDEGSCSGVIGIMQCRGLDDCPYPVEVYEVPHTPELYRESGAMILVVMWAAVLQSSHVPWNSRSHVLDPMTEKPLGDVKGHF